MFSSSSSSSSPQPTWNSGRSRFRLGPGLALVLALAALCSHAEDPATVSSGGRVALVIGNNAYKRVPLTNAINDARLIGDTLKGLGFQVHSHYDLEGADLLRAIEAFLRTIQAGDVALFFYSGHGFQLSGHNYLAPIDIETADEISARYSSYPVGELQEKLERSKSRLNIIVLDACRDNPFRGLRGIGNGLAPVASGRGTFVAYSAGPGQVASDNSAGEHSIFSLSLAQAMRQPGLGLNDVFKETRTRVIAQSNQTPWTLTNHTGEFFFVSPILSASPIQGNLIMTGSESDAALHSVSSDGGGTSSETLVSPEAPPGATLGSGEISSDILADHQARPGIAPDDVEVTPGIVTPYDAPTEIPPDVVEIQPDAVDSRIFIRSSEDPACLALERVIVSAVSEGFRDLIGQKDDQLSDKAAEVYHSWLTFPGALESRIMLSSRSGLFSVLLDAGGADIPTVSQIDKLRSCLRPEVVQFTADISPQEGFVYLRSDPMVQITARRTEGNVGFSVRF